jgi:hypothetical protein
MPFPYAYYREEYDGPLHGTELTSPVLYLTTALIVDSALASTGQLDVSGKSHLQFDTSGGNIVIDNLVGGKDGQVIFIHKNNVANSVTFKHNNGSLNKIYTAGQSDIVLPSGKNAGVIFICRDGGSSQDWFEIGNSGYFANGSVTAPSISFASEPLTGIFRHSAGTIGFSTSGVGRFFINNGFIRSAQPHRFADGTNAAPSITFDSDTDTGFYKAVDKIVLSADAVDRLAFTKAGNIQTSSALSLLGFDDSTPMRLRLGSLLSSDVPADDSLVPANGIYSKGNVRTAGQFLGTATSALYADIAERYEADEEYPVGTILTIGGTKDVTLCHYGKTPFAIVSDKPGFLLDANAGDNKTHPPLALAGKTPCRVFGKVKKGDQIVVAMSGVGQARIPSEDNVVIARSLEDKDTEGEGLVMVVTRMVI